MDPQLPNSETPSTTQDPQTAPASIGNPVPPKKPVKLFIIIAAGVLLLLILIILSVALTPKKQIAVAPTPTATPQPTLQALPSPTPTSAATPVMQYLPGKQYYNDSVYVITKDNPHQIVSVSVTRADQGSNYLQSTKETYFDGSSWHTDSLTTVSNDSSVVTNTMIRNWSADIDSTNKDTANIALTFVINGQTMVLSKQTIQDEINLLSLPDYTKFASQGTGNIVINNTQHPAMYVYTKAYSLNASSLSFLADPTSLSTEWMAMWDQDGNFYLADTLYKKNANTAYQDYKVGVVQDTKGVITKTAKIQYGQTVTDSGRYILNIGTNYFDFTYLTSYNYAKPEDKYSWLIGPADGNVKIGVTNPQSSYVLGIYETIIPR